MYFDNYFQASSQETQKTLLEHGITLGVVVDTNDPAQRHRVRVMCPALGDDPNPETMNVEHLPWALSALAAAGFADQGFLANGTEIEGEISYGQYTPPKIGAQAVVAIVDGNYGIRVVLGYITENGGANTLPHGRFKVVGDGIDGPFDVSSKPIEPLYSNNRAAFSNPYFNTSATHSAIEWMSRGADKSISAHGESDRGPNQNDVDDVAVTVTEQDGSTYAVTQGYAESRMGDVSEMSGKRNNSHEPQTSCWVSPGFQAISLDDRAGNTRIRIRTVTGHQIILDDTNERIYIATNQGKSWVEMDSCGNIDVHSETRVSVHSAKDINLTAGETIRMSAKQIHMKSTNDTRITATTDLSLHSNANIRAGALGGMYLESVAATHINAGTTLFIKSGQNTNVNSGASVLITSTGSNETRAGGNIVNSAPKIFNNSSAVAAQAPEAQLAGEKPAYHTNRVPQHEPWPRMMIDRIRADMVEEEGKGPEDKSKWTTPPIKFDGSDPAEFEHKSYTSKQIGRVDNGTAYVRNKHWHR